MCNYTFPQVNYNKNDYIKSCNYYELINLNSLKHLDTLDSKGKCVFHSEDIKWKRESDFYRLLSLLIDIYEEKKEKGNLIGVHFISKRENIPIDYLDKLAPCYLQYATFCDDVIMSEVEVASNNEKKSFDFRDCIFIKNFLIKNCKIKQDVNFSGIQVIDTFEIIDTFFYDFVEFNHSKFKGSLLLTNCHFKEQFFFQNVFFEEKSTLQIHSTFHKFSLFEKCSVNSSIIDFSDCEFYGETIFRDLKLEQQSFFNNIFVKKVLVFSGKNENRIFHAYTEFNINEELILGNISFDNTNISCIIKEHKENILQLQSTGKIIIERGCIKYRLQTDEIEIFISEGNQLLIDEITRAYTNFFILHTGKNLGIEIVERASEKITLFYFSDENMSQEEFLRLLEDSQKTFLGLFSNFRNYLSNTKKEDYVLNGINGIISLMTISFRAALLISLGKWKREDTKALLNSINSTDSILVNEELHNQLSSINVSNALREGIESNKLNIINFHQINQKGKSNVYVEKNFKGDLAPNSQSSK
ncbi:hypothetical protein [Flavivirga rizhaonensis]|uniref:Uncharacterized protein n=1 Tax=Flavivirga rizhaonensis TaxID=2559571 RepID=A0A4S1DVC3_9FLAO|nr:hypothetical protein [Flavivirga rizhaonensis]TGV01805.1 hypothetical protein EM932_14115 [Flavivirga rizhaonensis]